MVDTTINDAIKEEETDSEDSVSQVGSTPGETPAMSRGKNSMPGKRKTSL